VVVDVVDASNIERNLYLTTQLAELGRPLVIALNMTDVARARGIEFDLERLSILLGVPIVPMVGSRNEGTRDLVAAVIRVATGGPALPPRHVNYGSEIEEEIERITRTLAGDEPGVASVPTRWAALQLIERDPAVEHAVPPQSRAVAAASVAHLEKVFGGPVDTVLADRRYGFVSGACQEAVRSTAEARHSISDAIDVIVTSRFVGLPLFLALMYLVFLVTFRLGGPATDLLSQGFGGLAEIVTRWWPSGVDPAVRDLLVEGVIGGVGGVLSLLPNVLLLFMAIAILEDSGYLARAAFIMDHLMHHIGLHGKSFIPLVLGFGCTVPAVMATRILENRRDRLTTMFVAPLMSCGARFAIYSLLIPAFFPLQWRAPVLWSVYLVGVALAIAGAKLLRSTALRGESVPLVMELPPYRMPTIRGVCIHMWERGREYVKKAGTVILALSVVLWAMTTYPRAPEDPVCERGRLDATRAFHEGVRSLSSIIGIPTESETLSRVLLSRSGGGRFTTGGGVIPLSEDGRSDDEDASTSFLSMLDEVIATRERMATANDPGSGGGHGVAGRLLHQAGLTRLAQLEREDPHLYEAVTRYLDRIERPYRMAVDSINADEHAARLGYSLGGRVGRFMEPALSPLGFDWRIGTALIGAMAAREAFIAQLGIMFAADGNASSDVLQTRLRSTYPPLTGFAIMLFILIGSPCVPTLVVTFRESRSWKWPAAQVIGLTVAAYLVVLFVNTLGTLLGIGTATIG
jgi:ferrous iron transport protein B